MKPPSLENSVPISLDRDIVKIVNETRNGNGEGIYLGWRRIYLVFLVLLLSRVEPFVQLFRELLQKRRN